jgi:hypothetical protein
MLKGSYLRVLTPITTNGTNIKLEKGVAQYKETFLPLTAKKELEAQNRSLPEHLRKEIEVVSDGNLTDAPVGEVARKKPGPKPKTVTA